MTQDCSSSQTSNLEPKLPNGIRIESAQDNESTATVATLPATTYDASTSWGYVYITHGRVERFLQELEWIKAHGVAVPVTFVHRSPRTKSGLTSDNKPKSRSRQPKKSEEQEKPSKPLPLTVSGLVFLQGDSKTLQDFLSKNITNVYLCKDCATKCPAVIPDAQMKPFIELMKTAPERVTFLRDTFEHFAKNHVLLRVKTGEFAGRTGYIVRIKRDRQLVMQLGNLVVSISGVHNETFEEIPIMVKPKKKKSSKKRLSAKTIKPPKRPMPTKEVGIPKQNTPQIRHRKSKD